MNDALKRKQTYIVYFQVYSKDPYPLHSTIEQLAGELDVGVKTVVNWFHNHRMRDKNRFLFAHNSENSLSVAQSLATSSFENSCHSESQSPFKQNDCDSSSDYQAFLNKNNINITIKNNKTNKGLINEKNDVNESEELGDLNTPSTCNNNEMSTDTEEDGLKEINKVSKRKSARPQKMSAKDENCNNNVKEDDSDYINGNNANEVDDENNNGMDYNDGGPKSKPKNDVDEKCLDREVLKNKIALPNLSREAHDHKLL